MNQGDNFSVEFRITRIILAHEAAPGMTRDIWTVTSIIRNEYHTIL